MLEIYGSKAGYIRAVEVAVTQLLAEGFILKPGVGGIDDASVYRNPAQMQVNQPGFQPLP